MTEDEIAILYAIGNTLERIAKALEAQRPPQAMVPAYTPPAVVAAAAVQQARAEWSCPVHGGAPRWVPPGTSARTGREYRGFYACATPGCDQKPPRTPQNGPYAPQGQGVAPSATGELP